VVVEKQGGKTGGYQVQVTREERRTKGSGVLGGGGSSMEKRGRGKGKICISFGSNEAQKNKTKNASVPTGKYARVGWGGIAETCRCLAKSLVGVKLFELDTSGSKSPKGGERNDHDIAEITCVS